MGIELRLNIAPVDIMSLCFGDGRTAFLEALKHQVGQHYSPNLFANPVVFALNAVGSLLAEHVEPQIGTAKFVEMKNFLNDSVKARRALLDAAVKSVSSESEIEGLVNSHFSELQAIPAYFTLMSNVDISNADEPRRGLFGIGLLGLALIAIEANEMYGPETRTQFLQYVRQGMINEDFRNGIRIVLKSAGRKVSGKDVLTLFTEQKEAVRQSLLYKMKGEEREGTCAPDLLVQHAFAAHSLENQAIRGYLSESGVQEHELSVVDDVAFTWHRLVNYLNGGSITERQLKLLAHSHAERLSRLTRLYTKLSEIDASGAPGNGADKFSLGTESLLRVVVRAKAMYHPEASSEFLQHVRASALERPYDIGMLAAARSILPKTL